MSCATKTIDKATWLSAEQCLAQAWFAMREESTAPSEADLFLMGQGQEVGRLAHELYPSGVLVLPRQGRSAEEVTQTLLADASIDTLFEAAFRADSFVAKADILRRLDLGWRVLEVKSSFPDTVGIEGLIDDLAYTVMVLRKAGLPVAKASLALLSREYRHGEAADRLFEIVDVTEEVDSRVSEYAESAESVACVLLADATPEAELVSACRGCTFFAYRCLGAGLAHTVLELPGLHHKKLKRLSAAGIIDISRVPKSIELNERQIRAKDSALSGRMVVAPVLADALRAIEWPCRYLDFETVTTLLPLYEGHGCHQQILTQFSIHCRVSPEAEPSHVGYLADAKKNCERAVAEALIEHLGSGGSILVYSAFEATRIRALSEAFPYLSYGLKSSLNRIVDLLPLVRDHVYHPDFRGSFSIKHVLPALVSDLSYSELEVADGYTAVARFARMARGELRGEELGRTRQYLLDYCERDTLAMVCLHKTLSGIASKRRAAGA